MLKTISFASIAMTLAVGCSPTMQQVGGMPSASLADRDNDFFKTITISNKTEIDSSKLALINSQDANVKSFAQKMIEDHTTASGEVAALAGAKQVSLPTELDSKHQAILDELKSKSGGDFDKEYIDVQVKAHKETIDADQDEAINGDDAQVRALASKLLPTLQMHLSMAQKMQNGSSSGM